jgi:hypothetical protein
MRRTRNKQQANRASKAMYGSMLTASSLKLSGGAARGRV